MSGMITSDTQARHSVGSILALLAQAWHTLGRVSTVVRLGLVQTALGAIVVLTTSTLNRVMVVELALPAMLPGLLVGLHYAIQITRPRMGHGSDMGGRRTPWIIGGMAVLAAGGALAAMGTALMATNVLAGVLLAFLAFVLVGVGVGCSGTALLVLLSAIVQPRYRGMAATTVWTMMIFGFILTAVLAGKALDPFTLERLVQVSSAVSGIAFVVTCLAVWGVETRGLAHRATLMRADAGAGTHCADVSEASDASDASVRKVAFRDALREVWNEPEARRFSVFVFIAMLAYSAQDPILEPFAGAVFGMTPGESTQLSGVQHSGVLSGMILVALASSLFGGRAAGSLRLWTVGGCVASALMLVVLALGGQRPEFLALEPAVFGMGMANGAFAVAAIGSMMALVGKGARQREGTRMGMWGAAQALAFGLGGVSATIIVDLGRLFWTAPENSYGLVFMLQAALFLWAARLARHVYHPAPAERAQDFKPTNLVMELEQ